MNVEKKRQEILGASCEPEQFGVQYFLLVLESQEDDVCKWYAVRALGDLRAQEAKTALINILRGPDTVFDASSLHRICARSLGQIGNSATDELISLLQEASSHETKLAAIDALGEIRDETAVQILGQYLVSGDIKIRVWAGLSLGKIGKASLPVLKNALDPEDADLIYIVTDTLAIIADQETIPVLCQALDANAETVERYFRKGPRDRVARYVKIIENYSHIGSDSLGDLLIRLKA